MLIANATSDFNGDGIVTPLEALSSIQRIGNVRADVSSNEAKSVAAKVETSSPVLQVVAAVTHDDFGLLDQESEQTTDWLRAIG
jgi:hypothetical protein